MGGYGGGILNEGTLTLSGCTVSGNTARGGVGGGIANFGTLTLAAGCTVTGNSCFEGGGIANFGTLTSMAVRSPGTRPKRAGGIYNAKHASLTVTDRSKVVNNTATLGADIYNLGQEHISKDSTVGNK